MKLKVCSANILNDRQARQNLHLYQKDRVPQIIKDIKTLCDGTPDILYLCEAGSNANIAKIAEALGMHVTDKPYHYAPNDRMAFLVHDKHKIFAKVETLSYAGASSKNGMLRMSINDTQIFGVHYPYRAFKDMYYRYAFSRMITSRHERQSTLAVGDFNSLGFMISQLHLRHSGLKKVRWDNPPRTPNPELHGITAPHFVPSAVIDAMFYTSDIEVLDSNWLYSNTTDHPMLFAEFQI